MLTRHFRNVGIGINFGMTLLGCVAAVLTPMPFVFYFTGKKIRRKSLLQYRTPSRTTGKGDKESNGADESNSSSRSGTRVWSSNGEAREKEEKGEGLVSQGLCEALRASGRRLGVDLVLFRSTIPRVLLHLRRSILCELILKALVLVNTQRAAASILRFKMDCDSGMHWSTTVQVSFAAFVLTSVRDRMYIS